MIQTIYIGLRDAMIAEVAAFDPTAECGVSRREAKYLVMPSGDGQWDTLWFASRSHAKAYARELADHYKAPIAWI